jgi:serine protease Do
MTVQSTERSRPGVFASQAIRESEGKRMIRSRAKTSLAVLLSTAAMMAHAQSRPIASPVTDVPIRQLADVNDELQMLAARISPSVVKVEVNGLANVSDAGSPAASFVTKESSVGSGIIVNTNGLILTNAHVIEHATSVHVTIYNHPDDPASRPGDVRRMQAQVLGRDELTDIALLKVEAKNLPALTLADSDSVRVGQLAMAFGSPLGLENTFTLGVISSTQRQLNLNSPVVYLQTDASINPGSPW